MTTPTYKDLISRAAGTDGVPYDGDFLTNATIHARIKAIGVELGEIGGGLGVHESMQGVTAEAAREVLGGSRAGLQGVEDALGAISGAATGASAVIDTGKSTDAAVRAAQAQSEAVYAQHSRGAGEDPDEKIADDETTTGDGGDKGDGGGSNRAKPGEPDQGQESGGGTPKPGPSTHVSSDADGSRGSGSGSGSGSPTAPSTTAQPAAQQPMQQATPMATGQPMMGQAGGAGMQQPGGMPMNASPRTSTGSPVSKGEYSRMIADAVKEATDKGSPLGKPVQRGISPKADPSASDGGGAVVAAPIPTGNPTVTGGSVDPNQTSGRTASTTTSGAPGAGVPAKPVPMGSMGGGMMGGMGPMGQGLGGNQPPAGPQSPPKIKRDRETQAVLDGTAARDEALISSILRDDDLITTSTEGSDTDALLTDLRNEPRDRPTSAPELPPTPPAMVLRDDEPSAPPQRPGEPAEHERW